MNAVLTARAVTKRYAGQNTPVFEALSFESDPRARLVCVMGPDGAGKSTLLKMFAGVLRPDGGQVLIKGNVPSNADESFTRRCSYMSQTLGLYGELSVIENLRIFAGLRGFDLECGEDELRELLERVGLGPFADRASSALSGGMRQKLGLACAVATKPEFLILDEPTVGVDPVSRMELWRIIRDYLKERPEAVCLFSSAYLEEAESSDEVLMLSSGKIILQGDPGELRSKLSERTFTVDFGELPYTGSVRELMRHSVRFEPDSPIFDLCPRRGIVEGLAKPGVSLAEVEDKVRAVFGEKASRISVSARESALEDVYIDRTLDLTAAPLPAAVISDAGRKHEVIAVDGICKRFGAFTAVRHSTFRVHEGEIFGLLGPNGAGKTTTFRMLCALLTPTEGLVTVNGFDLRKAKSDLRATIGYVSQKFSLYSLLTVYQNLEYFGLSYGLSGRTLRDRILELMEEYHLTSSRDVNAGQLPFGLQRQLSMACALIHHPKILFLDEATSGADPMARRTFWDRICNLSASGTTVVVTTHFMDEAEYCDRFLIQDHGKILVLGAPDEICRKNGRRMSIEETFVEQVMKFRAEEKAS